MFHRAIESANPYEWRFILPDRLFLQNQSTDQFEMNRKEIFIDKLYRIGYYMNNNYYYYHYYYCYYSS